MMRTTQVDPMNQLLDPRKIPIQNVLDNFTPSSTAMIPVAQILQNTALETVDVIRTALKNTAEAKDRLSMAPPGSLTPQQVQLWNFVREVSGQTFCVTVEVYALVCEMIRKMRAIQTTSTSAGALIARGTDFSFATPNFFKAIKEFGEFQTSFHNKCTVFLKQVNKNLLEVSRLIQGHHNFEVALNSVEKLQADYAVEMAEVIKIENEWMPKFINQEQRLMDVNSKLYLIQDSLQHTEESLRDAQGNSKAAFDEMLNARQEWLNTPDSVNESRSYSVSSGWWLWKSKRVVTYQVSVPNPEKARAASLYRESQSFRDYLLSLEGSTEQKRDTLAREKSRWEQEKCDIETKLNQTQTDYKKKHDEAVEKMNVAREALDGAKKTVADMLDSVGIAIPEVCLKFIKSLADLPDEIMEQGIKAIGMNSTIATFNDWLNNEFTSTQEKVTITDVCKSLGMGDSFVTFFKESFNIIGFVHQCELEGVDMPSLLSCFEEQEIAIDMAKKIQLKHLLQNCDPVVAKKNVRIREEMQGEIIVEFSQFLAILLPSTEGTLSLCLQNKETPALTEASPVQSISP